MTQLIVFGALLVLAAVLILAGRHATTQAYAAAERDLPDELRDAHRVELREPLSMMRPFRLHGMPDHVYRTRAGELVVREDKASRRHLEATIIQASVYAAILRHAPPAELRGAPVAGHFWMRTGTPGHTPVRFERVPVLDDATLGRLIEVYRALGKGWNARRTDNPGLCRRRCPYFGTQCKGTEL